MWSALALLAAFVAAGALMYGLGYALKSADTYRADLTKGSGDFPADTILNTATRYQPDGFHLRITKAGGYRPSAVTSDRSYIAAEVTTTVTQVSSPASADFGPWCFYDPSNGYGMTLAADGQVFIMSVKNGVVDVIGDGAAEAWLPGQTRKLTIVCRLTDAGDKVSAFVNGVKTAEAAQPPSLQEIRATGFCRVRAKGVVWPG